MMTCPGRALVGDWPHRREWPLLQTPRSHEAAAARWIRCAARLRDIGSRSGRLHRAELAARAARPRPRTRLSRRPRVLARQGLLLAAAGQRPATAPRGTKGVDRNAPSEVGAEVWEFRAAIVRAGLATPSAALGTAAVG